MTPRRWWLSAGLLAVLGTLVAPLLIVVGAGAGVGSNLQCPAGAAPAPTVTLAGVSPTAAGNAAIIIQTGLGLSIPTRGLQVAVAVGVTESGLRNLANSTIPASLALPNDGAGHDHDSLGVFQQRGSWGTVASRMDVAASAGRFYRRLQAVPHWQTVPVTVAAQAVQQSATPTAYADAATLASTLVARLVGVVPVPACSAQQVTDVTGPAGRAITWAMKQIGAMYQWGGSCTDPFSADPRLGCDCSSFAQQAWAHAGVTLPRTSESQYQAGNVRLIPGASPTSLAGVPIGSLLFYEMGADVPGLPGHVALYIGGGRLIEASQPGAPVAIRPVYSSTWVAAGVVR